MKESFTREELKEVIEETVRDYFRNFIPRSRSFYTNHQKEYEKTLRLNPMKEASLDDLFTNVETWVDTFIDENGCYKGPFAGNFYSGKHIRNPHEDISHNDLKLMIHWNKNYGEQNGLSSNDVDQINTDAKNKFRNSRHYLGSFST